MSCGFGHCFRRIAETLLRCVRCGKEVGEWSRGSRYLEAVVCERGHIVDKFYEDDSVTPIYWCHGCNRRVEL